MVFIVSLIKVNSLFKIWQNQIFAIHLSYRNKNNNLNNKRYENDYSKSEV
nr:MAG TPA: hypothetical protein [Caudoviricetes sp.]